MVSKDLETEKSKESFLEKIGGKISVVTRDGSQIAHGNQDNSMHFVRPLKQRHLPVVALKYKAKTPMSYLQNQKGSNTFTTRIPIIPAVATTSTNPNPETTPIHILIKKRISEKLKPKKIVEDAIAPTQKRDITKIPTVIQTFSHNGDEEGSIFNLEQRDDGRKSRLKDFNQLEALVSKKISEWPSWGTNLMRDLTRIIEPLYAADMLRDSIKNIDGIEEKKNEYHKKDNQEYSSNTEKQVREFDFSTKSYDDNITVPSAGLFFAVIDTNRSQKKTRESITDKGQYSRAGSSYSEMHRARSSRSSILSPKSQSALSYHQTKDQDEMTTTSYYPTEKVEYEDIPKFENFDENLDIHHHEIELSKFQTENLTPVRKDDGFDYDEKSYLLQHESDMSRSVTSSSSIHSSSKSQNQKKFKASYFPPTDVKLGGLGPDKDSESYLSKLEKVKKQKEYADNIRKHVLSQKQNPKKIDHAPQVLAPIVYEKQSSIITKLPKINLKSMMGEFLSDAALTKHQKMKLYANQVKRPTITTSKSLQELKCLPSINRDRHISAPNIFPSSPNLNLMKLEEKHLQDLKAVEEIRRYYQ